MKRKLLSLAVALLCSVATWAASLPASGSGQFYLKNVGTGTFLKGDCYWGTKAVVWDDPYYITLTYINDGVYTLQSQQNNGTNKQYLTSGEDVYVDGDACNMTFTEVDAVNHYYTINNGTGNLYAMEQLEDGATLYKVMAGDVSTDYAKWQIFSKAELIAALSNATSSVPVDASFYIKDAGIDGKSVNESNWTKTNVVLAGGGNAGHNGESHNTTSFSISQTLSDLPHGKYKVTCNGYYRWNSGTDNNNQAAISAHASETEVLNAKFYAGTKEISLMSVAGDADAITFCTAQRWDDNTPNNQWQAAACFTNGYYLNTIDDVIVTSGSLEIGVKKDTKAGTDWAVFDNFKLYYYGNAVEVYDPEAFTSNSSATADKWYDFTVSSTGIYKITSSAAATIYYTQDNSEDADNVSSVALTAGSYIVMNLTNGNFYFKTSVESTIKIEALSETNATDVTTLFIANPSFETGDLSDWTNQSNAFSIKSESDLGNKVGTYYAFVNNNNTRSLSQTVSHLPEGNYVLSVNAKIVHSNTSYGTSTINMGSNSTPIPCDLDAATYYVAYEASDDASASISFSKNGVYGYRYFDNFTLTYYTELPAVSGVDDLLASAMAGDVRAALDAANTAYTGSKTAANYNALQTAIVNAKTSIAAFAANTGTDADWTGVIVNPNFETGNKNGWSNSGGTSSSWNDPLESGGLGEDGGSYRLAYWTNDKNSSKVYQTISNLPAGNYKLSAYFLTSEGTVVTLNAGSTTYKAIAGSGAAFPVDVYFKLDSKQNIEISGGTISSEAWYHMDNFKLTYNPTLPESISGVSGDMNATVASTQSTRIGTYNNENGQTIANMLSAQDAINAAVDSRIVYNNIATISSNYAAKAALLDAAGQSAYSTATNVASTGAETMYNAGTYTTASEAETAYSRDYITAVKAQTTENTDMTEAIVNPSFESDLSTGWSTGDMGRQSNTAFDKKSGTYYVERYHVAGDKYVEQTLTGFHSGVYTLTAAAYADASTSPKLYVKVGETESSTAVSSSKDYSVSFNYDGTSTLKIGFSATLTSNGWVCVDNFRLTYDAAALPESLTEVTGYMNADVKTAANTAIAAYNSSKTLEDYSAAQAAITDAEASRAIYVTINGLKTTYQGKADALDAAGQAAYTTAINTASTGAAEKYENGTYVTALEAELAFMADLAAASKAQTTAGANMTGAIINNSFETGTTDGWTYTASNDHGAKENSNNTYKMSGVDGSYLFNIWSTGNAISQTLTGMPAGTYRLTAVMGTDAGATLNVKLGDATGSASSVEKGTGVVVSVEKTLATAGDLTVGADAGGSQWYKVDNFQLTYLGVSKELTVAAKAGKYGTIIFPFTPNVSTGYDNITFYSCNSVSGEVLQLSEVDSPAANTPYIIKNDGEDFSLNVNGYGDRGLNDSYTSGCLTGIYTNAAIPVSDEDNSHYVLQTQGGVQGFYKVTSALTGVPNRAYLTVPAALGVKAFFFDVTDGINNLNVNDDLNKNEAIYNLAGQRVQKAVKGLYIVNGKKVVVK